MQALPPTMRPSFRGPLLMKSCWRVWLLRLAVAIALVACGGRSDENAVAPPTDAKIADRDTDGRSDGSDEADVADASSEEASADVSVDARIDGSVDARIDASPDARDALVDVRPDGGGMDA